MIQSLYFRSYTKPSWNPARRSALGITRAIFSLDGRKTKQLSPGTASLALRAQARESLK
jgi:hypothetical protein